MRSCTVVVAALFVAGTALAGVPITPMSENWDTYAAGTGDPAYVAAWSDIPGAGRYEIVSAVGVIPGVNSEPNGIRIPKQVPLGITRDLTPEIQTALAGATEVAGTDDSPLVVSFICDFNSRATGGNAQDIFVEISKGDVHVDGTSGTAKDVIAFGMTNGYFGASLSPRIFDGTNWVLASAVTTAKRYNQLTLQIAKDTVTLTGARNAVGTFTAPRTYAGGFNRISIRTINNNAQLNIADDTAVSGGAVVGGAQPAPTVSAVAPAQGPASGGTAVTIAGQNFGAGATVFFGGDAATSVVVVSATEITCVTPPHAAGAVAVSVTNADGQTGTLDSAFTYTPAPVVLSVAPAQGPTAGGTAATIGGDGFATGATVFFGGVAAASVTVVSAAEITCLTPPHDPGLVAVEVRNPDGQSSAKENAFLYVPAPTVASVVPAQGPAAGGTAVTIGGDGFATGATVFFGGEPATNVVVVSPTEITCVTPPHAAGAVAVSVTNADGQTGTLEEAFSYTPAPVVLSVEPMQGPTAGGTLVAVRGDGFAVGAAVFFGGVEAASVTVVSAATISCSTPPHDPGLVVVEVRNPDGQSGAREDLFLYVPAPTITSVAPGQGPATGGTAVTIMGLDFVVGARVFFGAEEAASVTVISATEITCVTPPHGPGLVAVTVKNPDAQSATKRDAFAYVPPPTIASVVPAEGPATGGTAVTIGGDGFAAGAAVFFGGVEAAGVTVVSATEITCATPPHGPGLVAVEVRNLDGQSAARENGFTFLVVIVFQRGETSGDGEYKIDDPIQVLEYLFTNRPAFGSGCNESGDANGDSEIDIADAVWLLSLIFAQGPQPPAPYPGCGPDPDPEHSRGCSESSPVCR